jgi:hypothetical protein
MSGLQGALGFSLHTGWAAAVAVIRDGDKIEAVFRRQLELMPANDSRFVYHRAAELSFEEAAALVESAQTSVRDTAQRVIREMLDSIKLRIRSAGIPVSAKALPNDLSKILASHALIHAAEGRLFQDAVVRGCGGAGLAAVCIDTREIWPKASRLCRVDEKSIRAAIEGIGKTIGPPWTADQKIATAAGLVALLEANPIS